MAEDTNASPPREALTRLDNTHSNCATTKAPICVWSTTTFTITSGTRTFTSGEVSFSKLEPKERSEFSEFSGVQSEESKACYPVRNIHNII